MSIVDELQISTTNDVKRRLKNELNQFTFFLEQEADLNTLSTIFQIQSQGLEEDGYFTFENSESDGSQDSKLENSVLNPSSGSTRKCSKSKLKFKKLSPLLPDASMIDCDDPNCTIKFGSRRAYKSHVRNKHQIPDWTPDPNKVDPVATCRMNSTTKEGICGAKLSITYFYQHLKSVHKVHRPSKRHHLRGFWEDENLPAFLYKTDPDPKYKRNVSQSSGQSENDSSNSESDPSDSDTESEEQDNGSQESNSDEKNQSPNPDNDNMKIEHHSSSEELNLASKGEINQSQLLEPEKSKNPDAGINDSRNDGMSIDFSPNDDISETPLSGKTISSKRKLDFEDMTDSSPEEFKEEFDLDSEDILGVIISFWGLFQLFRGLELS